MKAMKVFLLAVLALGVFSCEKDPAPIVDPTASFPTDPATGATVIGNAAGGDFEIKQNLTLIASKKYLLKGFVYVTDGFTLTIEPGTIIKGDKDTKSTLIIERGAKIIADGTADKPIVFTSNKPKGSRAYGDFGGVVLAGKAPVNQTNPTMEGGIRNSYGGTDPNDNSGSMKYVRIEFPGIAFQTDREINGLTLYGVGAGTTLDYIQVSYSGDDSFEWFGGTVNAKHLIAHRGFDDDFDTDFGYKGKVQFGVALRDPAIADKSTSNGFESDNFDPGTPATALITEPVFANMSAFLTGGTTLPTSAGSGDHGRGMHLRRNTKTSIFNSVLVGYPEGLRLDGNATWANVQSGALNLEGIVISNNVTKTGAGVALRNANAAGEVATFTLADLTAWFNTPAKKNSTPALADLKLNASTFSLTAPNFVPQTGSPLLTDAIWSNTKAADAFFEKTAYKGAFGATNWATGWTNFDPQNTDY